MDLTGYLVSFRVRNIKHPEPEAVHESFCGEFVLQGTCEHYIAEGLEGGPHLVVRVRPDHSPVFVALEDVEEALPQPGAGES